MKNYILNNYYDFLTMWLTASVTFFLVEYVTNWMEVVTLGGLLAGSFLEGLCVLLGLKLAQVLVGKDFFVQPLSAVFGGNYCELARALIAVAAVTWEGALIISRVMPGYTMHQHLWHILFLLVVYPACMLIAKMQILKTK